MSHRKPTKKSQPPSRLRIIGGSWRGRKLSFPQIDELRPTPDRVRETLFNWLAPYVAGAQCLDLFSGSGALGLEALSRGAQHTTFVDYSPAACQQLTSNLAILDSDFEQRASVVQTKADKWLESTAIQSYDLVFLDPPYRRNLLQACCNLLESKQLLNKEAWIYLETAADESLAEVPANWRLHRDQTAGQVHYQLFHRSAP